MLMCCLLLVCCDEPAAVEKASAYFQKHCGLTKIQGESVAIKIIALLKPFRPLGQALAERHGDEL